MIQKREEMKDNRGFSLVELIIVIAIMAILVAVLAPQFLKYVERSRHSADAANYDEISNAILAYGADTVNGGDIDKLKGDIEVTSTGISTATTEQALALYDAGLLKDKPTAKLSNNVEISCKSTQDWNKYTLKVTAAGEGLRIDPEAKKDSTDATSKFLEYLRGKKSGS